MSISISWNKFMNLARTKKYKHGYAVSDEGRSGTFKGQISELKIGRNGVSVSVSPCFHDGKRVSDNCLISSTQKCLVSIDEKGVIEYYVYMIGVTSIYPKGHPRAKSPPDSERRIIRGRSHQTDIYEDGSLVNP